MCTLAPTVLPLIVIRPDFGMAPYAWLFSTATSNECVGDEVSGFMLTDIDLRLERDLIEWAIDFERFCDHPRFKWPAFHGEGRLLARRLHFELGGQYAVRYVKPWEARDAVRIRPDPAPATQNRRRTMAAGCARQYR